jgi:hypothetical protein
MPLPHPKIKKNTMSQFWYVPVLAAPRMGLANTIPAVPAKWQARATNRTRFMPK